jgi:hypothetical protein
MCTCKNKFLRYNVTTQKYSVVTDVQWDKYLNGFMIHNTGNTNLYYNQQLIVPGASETVGGNFGEIYGGRIELMFRLPTPAPVTPANEVTIQQKFYLVEE